jgi:hypothetical protein
MLIVVLQDFCLPRELNRGVLKKGCCMSMLSVRNQFSQSHLSEQSQLLDCAARITATPAVAAPPAPAQSETAAMVSSSGMICGRVVVSWDFGASIGTMAILHKSLALM